METREYSWETWQRAVLAKTRELKINARAKDEEICKMVCSWFTPTVCHVEWSQSEREKHVSYMNACMWNLEKWYRSTFLADRAGIETQMQSMDRQTGKDKLDQRGDEAWRIHTAMRTVGIARGRRLYTPGARLRALRWPGGWEVPEPADVCVYVVGSLCCAAESNTTS